MVLRSSCGAVRRVALQDSRSRCCCRSCNARYHETWNKEIVFTYYNPNFDTILTERCLWILVKESMIRQKIPAEVEELLLTSTRIDALAGCEPWAFIISSSGVP